MKQCDPLGGETKWRSEVRKKKFGFAGQTRYHAGLVWVGKGPKRYKVNIWDA